jgi:hypothetical protein
MYLLDKAFKVQSFKRSAFTGLGLSPGFLLLASGCWLLLNPDLKNPQSEIRNDLRLSSLVSIGRLRR